MTEAHQTPDLQPASKVVSHLPTTISFACALVWIALACSTELWLNAPSKGTSCSPDYSRAVVVLLGLLVGVTLFAAGACAAIAQMLLKPTWPGLLLLAVHEGYGLYLLIAESWYCYGTPPAKLLIGGVVWLSVILAVLLPLRWSTGSLPRRFTFLGGVAALQLLLMYGHSVWADWAKYGRIYLSDSEKLRDVEAAKLAENSRRQVGKLASGSWQGQCGARSCSAWFQPHSKVRIVRDNVEAWGTYRIEGRAIRISLDDRTEFQGLLEETRVSGTCSTPQGPVENWSLKKKSAP